MKTYIYILLTIATFLTLTGCEEDKMITEQVIHKQPSASAIKQNPEDMVKLDLTVGDKLGVNGQECTILANGQISLYNVPAVENYLIYYPAHAILEKEQVKFVLPSTQAIAEKNVNANAFPLYVYTDNEGLADLYLNAVCGVLQLSFPAAEEGFSSITSIDIHSTEDNLNGEIVLDAVRGEITAFDKVSKSVKLEGEIDLSEGKDVYLSLPPMKFTDKLNVILHTQNGQGTCTLDLQNQTIEKGKILTVAIKDIEWKMTTNYYGTANSVLVKPGTSTVTVNCAPYYTTDSNYAYENIPAEDKYLPQSAQMLWNDVSGDFITKVELADDRKSFTVHLNGEPGNAVIIIYDTLDPTDKNDNILWSFHIWVTDISEVPLNANANGRSYVVLDRNLGVTSALPDDIKSLGLLYQWGRKDPFIGSTEVGKTTEATL